MAEQCSEDWISEKIANFKQFIKENSKDQELIEHYGKMKFSGLMWFAKYTLPLLGVATIEKMMKAKLGYPDSCSEKMVRYLQLFADYAAGIEVPKEIPEENFDD